VEACLEISLELEFITNNDYEEIELKRRELAIIMRSFVKGMNNR
jgi:hypothetical protein